MKSPEEANKDNESTNNYPENDTWDQSISEGEAIDAESDDVAIEPTQEEEAEEKNETQTSTGNNNKTVTHSPVAGDVYMADQIKVSIGSEEPLAAEDKLFACSNPTCDKVLDGSKYGKITCPKCGTISFRLNNKIEVVLFTTIEDKEEQRKSLLSD
jgi:hypothetical protein